MSKHKNIGSSFDDFLVEDGILEDVQAEALKRLIAWEMRTAMEKRGLSESALARRINPRSQSRATVRRLLDPKNKSATIATVARAASAMNYRVEFKLVPTRAKSRKGSPAVAKAKPRPARIG